MENNKNIQNENNLLINEFPEIIPELANIYSFSSTLNKVYFKREKKERLKEEDIDEWREYKVYKLKINGIESLKHDFMKAKIKIDGNEKLKNLIWTQFQIENILSLIIKESSMDNSKVSSTGVVGYLQTTKAVVKDVTEKYWLEDLNLDRKDPVDNLIIWFIYHKKINKGLIESWLKSVKNIKLSEKDKNELCILWYNIWPNRTIDLLKESKAKDLKEFKKYLREKLWLKWYMVKKTDPYYKIEYRDPLEWKDPSSFDTKLKRKIAEWLRYLEIINWLDVYLEKKTKIRILWSIISTENWIYSQIKEMRDNQKIFKSNANISQICNVILQTNGYYESEVPGWIKLVLIKEALSEFLN